ncbi:MAG: MFS transporter [Opitutales bacterium]|nr:MFS transporter [Opitutales bacterium]
MRNPGWRVLLIVVLIEGLSGFGRTGSFSPFLKDVCRDLALTSAQVSAAYGIANLFTGFLLPHIGRYYDRCSSTRFLRIFIGIFGSAFIIISLLKLLPIDSWAKLLLLFVCFAGIRMSVQSYMLTGRCMISTWFTTHRGLATGMTCLLLASIASSMPWLSLQASYHFSWNYFWFTLGVLWISTMTFLARWVRKPNDPPLLPKHPGNSVLHPFLPTHLFEPSFEKSAAFFFLMTILFFKAFQMTSLSFHLIPMCEEFGAKPEQVTLCLIGTPLVTIFTTFVVGHFFEIIGIRISLLAFLLLDILLLFCFPYVHILPILCAYGIAAGAYWGMRQILAYMILPKIFGTQTIGRVNGWASACLCLGSATGPYVFAKLHAWHSYALALKCCQGFAVFLLLIFVLICKHIHPKGEGS